MDDEELYRAYGELALALNPLPPGLDMDYFQQDPWAMGDDDELGDTPLMEESPAIDAVYDFGQPLIGCPCERVGASAEDEELCERPAVVSGGSRFRNLARALRARGVRNPEALAAWIGRRKYGAERFARMAAAGRRRAY